MGRRHETATPLHEGNQEEATVREDNIIEEGVGERAGPTL